MLLSAMMTRILKGIIDERIEWLMLINITKMCISDHTYFMASLHSGTVIKPLRDWALADDFQKDQQKMQQIKK